MTLKELKLLLVLRIELVIIISNNMTLLLLLLLLTPKATLALLID